MSLSQQSSYEGHMSITDDRRFWRDLSKTRNTNPFASEELLNALFTTRVTEIPQEKISFTRNKYHPTSETQKIFLLVSTSVI